MTATDSSKGHTAVPGSPRRFDHRVDAALIVVAIAWGSSYLAAKEVATPDTVFAFLTLRFLLAVGGLALLLTPKLRQITRSELSLGALFGLVLAAIFTLETYGVTKTSASNAGLIISLTIVMTPILDQCISRTRLPAPFYGAAMIAVLGVALLTQNGDFAAPGLGDVLILIAAAARAVHVTMIAHLSRGKHLDSARVTLVQLVTCLLVFAGLSAATRQPVLTVAADMSGYAWALTIYLALACTVVAFFIQMWAVRRTSPGRVSLLLGTEPLWAAAIGVGIAHDPLTAAGITGALLILLRTNYGRVIDTRHCARLQPHPTASAAAHQIQRATEPATHSRHYRHHCAAGDPVPRTHDTTTEYGPARHH